MSAECQAPQVMVAYNMDNCPEGSLQLERKMAVSIRRG